ncbi:MAG: N-acetylmuramoyl-L-alanine amidase [Rhodospirillales bacterium]|nr:N-acetylmuramoyl-L-alanine amidase [Rhodospirillales bacterium]
MTEFPSPNFDDRPEVTAIDMLVLHYTGMPTANDALARLCDPAAQVGAHYMIDEDGTVHALIPEDKRAWHAGVSFWRGETDINGRSIGIELVNPGHEFGYRPFPDAQIEALILLAKGILRRHPIPPRNVVGHSDIAPSRKTDPGELFDWKRLAAEGIGLWPEEGDSFGADTDKIPAMLREFGYDTSDLAVALMAFRRRFLADQPGPPQMREAARRLGALLSMAGIADGT